jgi:ABC-type multidrug transport system ATPase subunit
MRTGAGKTTAMRVLIGLVKPEQRSDELDQPGFPCTHKWEIGCANRRPVAGCIEGS